MAAPANIAAPTLVVNSDNSVTVTWVAPANNGSAITAYLVTVADLTSTFSQGYLLAAGNPGEPSATQGAKCVFTIPPLLVAKTYSVSVYPTNNDGYGSSPATQFTITAISLTVGYLMDRTFDLLLGSAREQMAQVSAPIGATDTTIAFENVSQALGAETYIAIDDEVVYVWSAVVSNGTATATVQRGMKGTTAVTHTSGSVAYLNPFFTRYQVRQTLRDEIRSWGPQVFAVKTLDIAAADFINGYDLAGIGTYFRVLDLTQSPDTLYGVPSDKNWARVPYRMVHSANTTDFPSGNALIVTVPVFDSPRTFHLTYSAPFDVDTAFDDATPLASVGIDNSDVDIAPYGAAWRLASSREMRRMLFEAQGASGDLQAIPPMYQESAAEKFKTFRDSRLNDAEVRLLSQYPVLRTG